MTEIWVIFENDLHGRTDVQTDRQIERQTDRQTETNRQTDKARKNVSF